MYYRQERRRSDDDSKRSGGRYTKARRSVRASIISDLAQIRK
jgi:hypothetical protein